MKYTIITIVVVAVLFFLSACRAKKIDVDSKAEIAEMTLSTSKCFGKCKVYELKILKNKNVTYKGIENVENIGLFSSVISDQDYQALILLYNQADFQNLNEAYLTGVRDKQKITLGYNQKKVKYENRAASEEVKAITKKMEDIIESLTWEKN